MSETVIRTENLVHVYPRGEVKALKGVNLEIKKDDVVVGILTGRQKDPALAVEYHINADNMFARPPTNH